MILDLSEELSGSLKAEEICVFGMGEEDTTVYNVVNKTSVFWEQKVYFSATSCKIRSCWCRQKLTVVLGEGLNGSLANDHCGVFLLPDMMVTSGLFEPRYDSFLITYGFDSPGGSLTLDQVWSTPKKRTMQKKNLDSDGIMSSKIKEMSSFARDMMGDKLLFGYVEQLPDFYRTVEGDIAGTGVDMVSCSC